MSNALTSLLRKVPAPIAPEPEDEVPEPGAEVEAVQEVGEEDEVKDTDEEEEEEDENPELKADSKGKPKKFNILYPRKGLRLEQYKLGSARLWVKEILYAPPKPRIWPKPASLKDPQPQNLKMDPKWEDVHELLLYSKNHDATFFALAVQMPPGKKPGDLCFKALTKTAEETLIVGRQYHNTPAWTSLERAQERIFAYRNRSSERVGFVSDNTVIEWDALAKRGEFTGAESFYYTPDLLFGERGPYLSPHIFQKKHPQEAEQQGLNDLIMEPPTDDNDEIADEAPELEIMEAEPNDAEEALPEAELSEEPVAPKAAEDDGWRGREPKAKKSVAPPAAPAQLALFEKTPPKRKTPPKAELVTLPSAGMFLNGRQQD